MTVNVEAYRERIDGLLRAGDGYAYLNAALPYLAQRPDDDHTRLMSAREFLRAGLLGPGRELLEAGGETMRANPEIARLMASLPQSTGAKEWERRCERFERNLEALARRGGGEAEAIREAWRANRERFELFVDGRGGEQVRMYPPFVSEDSSSTACGGAGRYNAWLPQLGDHRKIAEANAMPADHGQIMPGPYLFEGVGLGWYFDRVWRATRDTFLGYSCALYVLEPRPEFLAIALHLHNWAELLADARVMLFLGDRSAEVFAERLEADADLPAPKYHLRLHLHPESHDSHRLSAGAIPTVESIIQTRQRTAARGMEELERRHAGRDAAYWAKRFEEALSGRGRPLRILASVSTHTTFLQYSMRDAQRAFRQLGHECEIITEKRPFEAIGPSTYHDAMLRFEPDLFFVIDHVRASLMNVLPANLPLLTWDQDALRHVFTRENVAKMSPLDMVVGLPHIECTARFGRDPSQFRVAHMATCPEQFDSTGLTDAELAPYRCDVSYVSHGSETPEAFHQKELAGYADPNARRLLDRAFTLAREAMLANKPISGQTLRTLLAEAEAATGVKVFEANSRDHIVTWHLWRLCDRHFRHQALIWAGEWARKRGRTLRIYGNGWEKHPVLAPFAAGPAKNGRELLCIYRSSRINLQIMPAGFLHQRSLDGLAAGGFFLVRATAADRRDLRLHPIRDEIVRRGLRTAEQVSHCGDDRLVDLFAEVRSSFGYREEESDLALHWLMADGQWDYPTEVFPSFADILFHDQSSFENLADLFVEDAAQRERIAASMRSVVVERYSYKATIRRFLAFMSEHMRTESLWSSSMSPSPIGA